jgi:hypothetical protein
MEEIAQNAPESNLNPKEAWSKPEMTLISIKDETLFGGNSASSDSSTGLS